MKRLFSPKIKTFAVLSKVFALAALLAITTSGIIAQKTRVACVGNSVTFGYKIKNRKEHSYPSQLQSLLGADYKVGNFGKSGATLLRKGHRPYMQQKEFKQAVDFNPDILIVSLGLNDTDPRNWPNHRDDFIADYMALIQSFEKPDGSMPEVWIGLMTPIFHRHPRFKSGTRDWFWQIQNDIRQVAENCNANIIDWHTPLHSRPDLFPDALHPTKEGAAIMARIAYQHITGDFGGLKTALVFDDHMVLQRDTLIGIWGRANSNETIQLELNNTKVHTTTGYDGHWQAEFPAMPAGGPYQLKIQSKSDTLIYQDVMIGEVWLCSGQSNMAFRVKQSARGKEISSKNNSIRLLNFQPLAETNNTAWDSTTLQKINNLEYLSGHWEPATHNAISNFSAIGWYFGEIIEKKLDVPVGLIQVAVGGAPTEAFIDRKSLEFHPRLVNFLYNWQENDHIMDWCRQRAGKNISKSNNDLQRHPFHPAYLYEVGIKTIANFPIKGVLWYQGESNAHNMELHEILFPALIDSWREALHQPDLPFIFAQLSSLNRPSLTYFRNSQRQMAHQIPNVSMVVTSDHGNKTDVHPKHKYPVGKRMAQTALNRNYGQKDIPHGSISIDTIKCLNDQIKIAFTHSQKLQTSDSGPIRELEKSGPDKLFHKAADATLKKNSIVIPFKEEHITAIRYGWKPYSKGNITNENGIPVSTFRIQIPSCDMNQRKENGNQYNHSINALKHNNHDYQKIQRSRSRPFYPHERKW